MGCKVLKKKDEEKINKLNLIYSSIPKDETGEIELLINKLEKEYQSSKNETKSGYADAKQLICEARSIIFGDHKECINEDKEELINISVSKIELLTLIRALLTERSGVVAQHYIKNSTGKNESNLWETVAELQFLKIPGESRTIYDGGEIIPFYSARVRSGMKPKDAAVDVKVKFKFPTQSACNKYICNEINRRVNHGYLIYADLKKPSNNI